MLTQVILPALGSQDDEFHLTSVKALLKRAGYFNVTFHTSAGEWATEPDYEMLYRWLAEENIAKAAEALRRLMAGGNKQMLFYLTRHQGRLPQTVCKMFAVCAVHSNRIVAVASPEDLDLLDDMVPDKVQRPPIFPSLAKLAAYQKDMGVLRG